MKRAIIHPSEEEREVIEAEFRYWRALVIKGFGMPTPQGDIAAAILTALAIAK